MENKYTNELLRKKFKNQFELVSYAISLAENLILSGREPRVKIDNQNPALQVLAEIVAGKDLFEPVILEPKKHEEIPHPIEAKVMHNPKSQPERKRARKILVD
jgi:hypothetical protein